MHKSLNFNSGIPNRVNTFLGRLPIVGIDVVGYVILHFGLGRHYQFLDEDHWEKYFLGGICIELIYGNQIGIKLLYDKGVLNNILELHGMASLLRRLAPFNYHNKDI